VAQLAEETTAWYSEPVAPAIAEDGCTSGGFDGRIVPVVPPPIAKFLGKVTIAQDEKQSTNRHPD